MKILYLAHRIPYPPNKGDKIRSFNEIKYLSTSHEIHLGCLADNPADLKYESDLKKYCKRVCVVPLKASWAKLKSVDSLVYGKPLSVGYFHSKRLQDTVNHQLSVENYDAIICFSSAMAEYLFRSPPLKLRFSSSKALLKQKAPLASEDSLSPYALTLRPLNLGPKPRLIMDFCDVDSDKWRQYSQKARFPLSLLFSIENKLLLKYEKRINQNFDHSVFVSQKEADLFSFLCPGARNLMVIPNGVDCEYFSPDKASTTRQFGTHDMKLATNNIQYTLLFNGAMNYYANVDGIRWFCGEIFPMIKKEYPNLQLYIVGSDPHPKVQALGAREGVRVTGFVDDIRPFYHIADLCVIPLRLARGVQNKVLEAMAMGKAVICTRNAIEGIQAVPGQHCVVEDTPVGFSEAVLRFLGNQNGRKRLGARARELVKKNYDWSNHMKRFDSFLQAAQENIAASMAHRR
jgi:sugar transferase (PEP-CTERM/EpsH1 system associated)